MSQRVRVFAPGSASNLGPGFDVLGLALSSVGDTVEVEPAETAGIQIVEVTGAPSLSTDATQNTAGIAASAVLRRLDPGGACGVRMWVHKQMPLASGLGSSAASSVAGAMAVNCLMGGTLSQDELVSCALEGEAAVSGSVHADNVAPSVLGGIVLVRRASPLDLVSLPVPERLRVVIVHPHIEVRTSEARRMLVGRRFEIDQAVVNLGNIASLVCALYTDDLERLGRSIHDALVEPVRSPLIPNFREVKAAASAAGALGCSISGSGPSVFAFADSDETAQTVSEAMQAAFRRAGVASDPYVGPVDTQGARPLS